jgi:hypothetical protein
MINNPQNSEKCLKSYEDNFDKIFNKYSSNLNDLSADNKVCLIRCTDKLNFPSEELTCYDRCEESYNIKLIEFKENLYKDCDKFFK